MYCTCTVDSCDPTHADHAGQLGQAPGGWTSPVEPAGAECGYQWHRQLLHGEKLLQVDSLLGLAVHMQQQGLATRQRWQIVPCFCQHRLSQCQKLLCCAAHCYFCSSRLTCSLPALHFAGCFTRPHSPASCPAPASAVCATSFTCSLPTCWLPFLQAFNTNYHDTGLFGVYATANKDDPVDDVAWAIMREISRMCYSPVDEDIIRAKNQLKAAILFSQDNLNGDLCLVDGNGLLVVSLMRWGVCVA